MFHVLIRSERCDVEDRARESTLKPKLEQRSRGKKGAMRPSGAQVKETVKG